MKQVWQCDYCDFTGTKEMVEEHEKNECRTCTHCRNRGSLKFENNKIHVNCNALNKEFVGIKMNCDKFEKLEIRQNAKSYELIDFENLEEKEI